MIPLVLLALLGAAFAAYELSPRAHVRMDDYARAIQAAHAAHAAADAHLANANTAATVAAHHAQVATQQAVSPDPHPAAQDIADAHSAAAQVTIDAAIDHAVASTEANQVAAQSTVDAATKAKTPSDRQVVAQSATNVLDRGKQIASLWTTLGVGQCEARTYQRVTSKVKDALIARLHAAGMIVTGNNPWNIDTHEHGVKLRAVWDPTKQALKLIVTTGAGGIFKGELPSSLVCPEVWKKIDPIMTELTRG